MKTGTNLMMSDDEIKIVLHKRINNILNEFDTLSKKGIKQQLLEIKKYVVD